MKSRQCLSYFRSMLVAKGSKASNENISNVWLAFCRNIHFHFCEYVECIYVEFVLIGLELLILLLLLLLLLFDDVCTKLCPP